MKVLTGSLIKESEENAVKGGAFSFRELMYRAGNAAARIIAGKYGVAGKKITVLCGSGNNGGDGFVAAAALKQSGADVTVVTPFGPPKTENAKYYYGKLCGIKLSDSLTDCRCDILIDALFGIGLKGPLNETAKNIIKKANSYDCVKAAVDIPSGLEADTGKVWGDAFSADLTVTFIALKPCFVLPFGSDYCGETVVADIGVPTEKYSYLTTEKPIFKKRRHNSHKGTFGTALLFCGSYGMAGAAILAARAALRSGAGIVKSVLCDSIYAPFTAAVPEAVCVPVKQNKFGTLSAENIDIINLLTGADAVLVGCGMGNNADTAEIVRLAAQNTEVPLIIDADGINAICGSIDIIKKRKAPVIITPHPGEMARLLGTTVSAVEENRVSCACDFARENGCTVVLKGANTIIAAENGDVFFNCTGNPGMSTGGSGDVLSGIIAALAAQGMSATEAAKAAVYLHGEAGDRAALKRGQRALIPSDIIEEL